jgi:hypothetical protein
MCYSLFVAYFFLEVVIMIGNILIAGILLFFVAPAILLWIAGKIAEHELRPSIDPVARQRRELHQVK